MAGQDKFKSQAPVFEVFKAGESMRIKKVGVIVDKTQRGLEKIEQAIGDIHNRGVTFEAQPLFQNSLGRSIGPVSELSITPARRFAIVQNLKSSLHQGLIRWPESGDAAIPAGNQSLNVIPNLPQLDKMGVGCTQDSGYRCLAGFQEIYDQEKDILDNGQFRDGLSDWTAFDCVQDADERQILMNIEVKYNLITWSEDADEWTPSSSAARVVTRTGPDPFLGQGNLPSARERIGSTSLNTLNRGERSANAIYFEMPTDVTISGTDFAFSVWLAASGETTVHLGFGKTPDYDVNGDEWGDTDESKFWSVHLSGNEGLRRYWVHGRWDTYQSGVQPRIYLGRGELLVAENVYAWGAQLDLNESPSDYMRTTGAFTSGTGQPEIFQTFDTIPGHVYQVHFEAANGVSELDFSVDGESQANISTGATNRTFIASRDTTTIRVVASGSIGQEASLTQLTINPGTPCHALNCPGFTGYQRVRQYRAVLPPITVSGHQYFGNRLRLPDQFRQSFVETLPTNVLGMFDHELNRMVPDTVLSWNLANWPIGGLNRAGQVLDPEFLDDASWTSEGGNEFPQEFSVTNTTGGGTLARDENLFRAVAVEDLGGNATEALWFIPSGTTTWDGNSLGLHDGDGSANIFGPINRSYRMRFRIKPYSWLKNNSKDGAGFGLFTSCTNGGGDTGSGTDADTQYFGINDSGYPVWDTDTLPRVLFDEGSPINYGEWNDVEFVVSGSQTDGVGPLVFCFVNGNFMGSGVSNSSDWGGGTHAAAADNHWLVNSRNGGDCLRGWCAGIVVERTWDWIRYTDQLQPGGSITPYPSTVPHDDYSVRTSYQFKASEDTLTSTNIPDERGRSLNGLLSLDVVGPGSWVDKRSTSDLSLIGLEQLGYYPWYGNEISRTAADDQAEGELRNHWRLIPSHEDSGGFPSTGSTGYFEAIVVVQSGINNDGDLIFVRRHVPGGISGMPVINYEFGVNVSGGPYLTIAGFNNRNSGASPISGAPDGYEAMYCGNAYSGVTLSGTWFFNDQVDIRDGLTHHVLFRMSKKSGTSEWDWFSRMYVDGVLIGSGTFMGPDQVGKDWTEWSDVAGGGDRGYYRWEQQFYTAASGAMTFQLFSSNKKDLKASGTLYQFSWHEATDYPWSFSTSGFHDYTRRLPFPMAIQSTRESFIHAHLDEGWGPRIHTLSESAEAWDESAASWPYPLYDVAEHVSGALAVYSEFDPNTGNEKLDVDECGATVWRWYDAEWQLSGLSVGTNINPWRDRGPNNYHLSGYTTPSQVPVVRLSNWGKKYARMDNANDFALRYGGTGHSGTGDAKTLAGAYTIIIVWEFGTGLFHVFGNDNDAPGGFGSDSNDGFAVPVSNNHYYTLFYAEAQSSSGQQASRLIQVDDATSGDMMVGIVRRAANGNHYVLHNGKDYTRETPLNDSTRLNFHGIYTLDSDSISSAGAAIAELAILEGDIGHEKALKLYNYLAEKWKAGKTKKSEAALAWTRTDQVDVIETSGVPTDRLQLCADTGERIGLEKTFPLDKDDVGIWTYRVGGNLANSGVIETYTAVSGSIQVDHDLDGEWLDLSGVNNPWENAYRVSGAAYPGESAWATEANGYWTITRRVRALENESFVKLAVEIEGDGSDNCLYLESYDLLQVTASSSKFGYCGQPILGLNWEGDGEHILDENLLTWSDNPVLWQHSSGTVTPDSVELGQNTTTTFFQGVSGYLSYHFASGTSVIKDSTLTFQMAHRSNTRDNSDASARVDFLENGVVVDSFPFDMSVSWTELSVITSGVNPLVSSGLEIRVYPPRPGGSFYFTRPLLHHGSGVVDYIATYESPVETYRRQVALDVADAVNVGWVPGYARIQGQSLIGTLANDYLGGVLTISGGTASVPYHNLPASGVVRVANGEFAYRGKFDGNLAAVVERWRGTPLDVKYLTSGSDVVYVPLPLPYTNISDDKVVTMRDTLPAADGAWRNPVRVQLYNTDISNLDRWSMTASAVPLARAVGGLMTAFVQHTSDRSIHFDQELICQAIVDPGSVCATNDQTITLTPSVSQLEELTETLGLIIETTGFIDGTTKTVTVRWGDGEVTTLTGTGTSFRGISHIYDLGPETITRTHTISVTVEDTQANVTITGRTFVIVTPADKASQAARAVLAVPTDADQTARAVIQAQFSGVQAARAHLTT